MGDERGRVKGSRKMDALSVSDVDLFVWLTFSHLWASILKCSESWHKKYLISHFRLEERLSCRKCSCNLHILNNSLWVEIKESSGSLLSLDSISTFRLVCRYLQLLLNLNQVWAISDGNNPLRPRLTASLASYWQFKQHILQLSTAIISEWLSLE